MPVVPLSEQVDTPAAIAAILLYAALFLAPVVALWRADRRERWLAIGFMIATIAVRLPQFSRTPPGVNWDDVGVLLAFLDTRHWDWVTMLRQGPVSGAPLWCNLPWYLTYRLTDSILAMRIDGLAWSAVLALYAVVGTSRFFGLRGAAVTAAVLSFTPWSLWMSRHPWGPEIILQQLYLFVAVDILRTRPNWRALLVCALMLVLLQLTYLAARISVVLPIVLLLAGPWEAGLLRSVVFLAVAYVIAAIGMIPHVLTQPPDFWTSGMMTYYDPGTRDWGFMVHKALHVLGSLVWPEYSMSATLALRGAQTLSPVVLLAVIAGIFASLGGPGRGFLVAALLGAVPCWISQAPDGNSHRMMMMLLPMALLAGAAPRLLPARFRSAGATLLVGLIAVTGLRTWLSPGFWSGLPDMMQWAITFHDAAERELNRHDGLVRVHPGEGGVWLLARERGLHYTAYDLETTDFAGRAPLTVVWRTLDPLLIDHLEQIPGVKVERVDRYITVTHFPDGVQGLLGDPPALGWRFSTDCERATPRRMEFVTPLVLEEFPHPQDVGPCTLRWQAKALRRIVGPLLVLEWAGGTVRIDDVAVHVEGVTQLPTIQPGQHVAIDLQSKGLGIKARLLHADRGGATLVPWDAVAPEENAP